MMLLTDRDCLTLIFSFVEDLLLRLLHYLSSRLIKKQIGVPALSPRKSYLISNLLNLSPELVIVLV